MQSQTGEEVTLLPVPESWMLMDYNETAVDKVKSGFFFLSFSFFL